MTKNIERGQFAGPLLFILTLIFQFAPTKDANTFLAIFIWVICNWLFTSIPLFATGLFGVGLSVILGLVTAKEAFSPLSDPLIYLFLGGFFIAKAFEVIELDKKLSLWILSHPIVRGNVRRSLLSIILLTAFISMWVSNTATTAMMIPLVLGMMKNLGVEEERPRHTLLLSIAYAATIGGLATPLGSPPNIIVMGMLEKLAGIKLSFFTWMMFALPITFILLIWLNRFLQREFRDFSIKSELLSYKLTLNKKDKYLILIFCLAVFLWFFPSLLIVTLGQNHELSKLFDERLNPGVVSIYLACFLFIFPLRSSSKILTIKEAMSIDWGSLILFGTGISLGQVLFKVGIADWIGGFLMNSILGMPNIIFLFIIIAFTLFFTELASNTATANILLPLIIGTCLKANLNPIAVSLACALSCNLAFMLPVGTPPNAIVYGTGMVSLKEMMRSGFMLNIVSVIAITLVVYFFQFFL